MSLFDKQPEDATLRNAIHDNIRPVILAVCERNRLGNEVASDLERVLYRNVGDIETELMRVHGNRIPSSAIPKLINDVAVDALNKANIQPEPTVFAGGGLGGGLGGRLNTPPPVNTNIGIDRNTPLTDLLANRATDVNTAPAVVAEVPKPETKPQSPGGYHKSEIPLHTYETVQVPDINRYNTTFNDSPMFVVHAMNRYRCLQDNSVTKFNNVYNPILEISVPDGISNIIKTNPLIYSDEWISRMTFESIHVLPFGSSHTDIIDMTMLDLSASGIPEIPTSIRVGTVINSINTKPHNFVKAIEKLVIPLFNRMMRASARISTNNVLLQVSTLGDIPELFEVDGSPSDVMAVMSHPSYHIAVLRCFSAAIKSVITPERKTGYRPIADSIFDMKACPNFIIRTNGICEKDPELDVNEVAMEYIKKNWTVICQLNDVVVSNFMPTGLHDQLKKGRVIVDETRTLIDDMTLSNSLGTFPIFYCKGNDDTEVQFISGTTLDGIKYLEELPEE